MKLLVISHKVCWPSAHSPSGFATDGGFAFQMQALSELFDAITLVLPCASERDRAGEIPLTGRRMSVVPLQVPSGQGTLRKAALIPWFARNGRTLFDYVRHADAVHTPVPSDIGTVGLLMALSLGKPLFVRHCGNWHNPRTVAEHFWRWLLERCAGGKNVVLATGGAEEPPSHRNSNLGWIFSTSLTEAELSSCALVREGLPGAAPRLIIACRQEIAKGTGALIESLPLLIEQFPGIRLDVVGDGGALSQFRELAVRLGLANRVNFHGQVSHDRVLALLRNSDVFCFPTSSSEGFPKAVLEALASGVPVVTTRVSVLPRLIADGGGILLESADPEAIAAAVRSCLSAPDRYHALSTAGIRTARQYSLEHWKETIAGLLTAGWGPLRAHA